MLYFILKGFTKYTYEKCVRNVWESYVNDNYILEKLL